MPLSAQERFASLTAALHAAIDTIDASAPRRTFGATSLKIHGRIFAMLVGEQLVVKLPRQRVEALIAAGEGQRFDPGHGRPMKQWLTLDAASALDWSALAHEALAFVGG